MEILVTSANVLSWAAVPLTLLTGWLFIPDRGKGKRVKPVYVPRHSKEVEAWAMR